MPEKEFEPKRIQLLKDNKEAEYDKAVSEFEQQIRLKTSSMQQAFIKTLGVNPQLFMQSMQYCNSNQALRQQMQEAQTKVVNDLIANKTETGTTSLSREDTLKFVQIIEESKIESAKKLQKRAQAEKITNPLTI